MDLLKLDTLQGIKKVVFRFFTYVVEIFFNNYATQLFLHLLLFNLVSTTHFGSFIFV